MRPYQIKGRWYYPAEQPDYNEVGVGSWYGEQFHNRFTSNGEVFDMDGLSAAHKTLPLPSLVEVTNLDNGRKITLRVNDRGPFVDNRIIDLSKAAADELGYRQQGVARVRVRYLGPAPKSPFDSQRIAQLTPRSPLTEPAPAVQTGQPYAVAALASATPPPAAVSVVPISAPASPPPSAPAAAHPGRAPRFALASSSGYRVQVASFANRANAERAVALLGQAVIEPAQRDGAEIYRVILGPAADEPSAWALRDHAASKGFADAKVLRP
jgi:rare lipoprotein A